MLNRLAICLLVTASLTSCATLPAKNPDAEIKFIEANVALDSLQQELKRYYSDLGDIMDRITMLISQPGWQEMESIIRSSATSDSEPREVDPEPKTHEAIEKWNRKWNASGEEIYSDYLSLVGQCTFLEVRRLALRLRLRSIEIGMVHALATEVTAGRKTQQRSIEQAIDELGRFEQELNAYIINDLGLYEPASSERKRKEPYEGQGV